MQKFITMRVYLTTVFIASMLVSCSPSTQIVKSWQEPNTTISMSAPENKVLVISMVKDEASRRVVEDQMVKRIKGNAVASYTFLTTDMLKAASPEALSQKLTEDKFSHVLLMRLADIEKETSYVPGSTTGYYGGYGRYYAYGASMYSSPGYYTTDKNYMIETTVYSVSPDKLLWTGTTKTVNPSKVENAVNDIADAVSDKMKKDGFLKQ